MPQHVWVKKVEVKVEVPLIFLKKVSLNLLKVSEGEKIKTGYS